MTSTNTNIAKSASHEGLFVGGGATEFFVVLKGGGDQFFFQWVKGGTRIFLGSQRVDQNFFLRWGPFTGGPEFFSVGKGGDQNFFVHDKGGQKKMVTGDHKQMAPPPDKK